METESDYIAFAGWKCVASGPLGTGLRDCKDHLDCRPHIGSGWRSNPGGVGNTAMRLTDRLMTDFAGNLPGFEEAYRALYSRDRERLAELADGPVSILTEPD